ncbi:MAG: glucose-1-phosphate cytidylyltransferase [Rhodobacterales bacterium 34-62-10]|nr:MAG: glucose-1-phosphate cytidylyltransferase [Rhodobacterales bacterium 34-62-10]
MKTLILAGGFGTRISEETSIRPKPMVEIGGRPIIWHIMKSYAQYGLTDFVVLGGYKVDFIRNYFLNYTHGSSDFTVDLATGELVWQRRNAEAWRVTVLDTGANSMTGGRIRRAREIVGNERFCLTYGDGVSDVDIGELLKFHERKKAACTVTAVVPPGRFGVLAMDPAGEKVEAFREKDQQDVGLINGGFFVCEPSVFELIEGDDTIWEQDPMRKLAAQGELAAFRHDGFWQAMDTLRDRMVLEQMWESGKAPWATWR